MNHPWRDAHGLGQLMVAALILLAAAGVAGAIRMNGV